MKPIALFCLLILTAAAFAACGGDSEQDRSDVDGVRFEKVSVFDPAANGEAFTFLKPSGWNADGGVVWRHDLSNLASTSVQAWNPQGSEAVEVFPLVPFTWQEGGVAFFPVGSLYLGNQVQPPIFEPVDFVTQMILPTFRFEQRPQVIDWEETPGVSEEVWANVQEPGLTKTVRSGRVRVEYMFGETLMHEDFYVTLVFSQSQLAPIVLWGPERIYSFRAAAGTLDESSALMHSIVFSAQVNQRWLNEYLQVVDLWHQGQLQSIQNAGELSRYIAQVNDEIMEITTETFERQQATNDRMSREFSELIRGVETYNDPFGEDDVELPSGYDFAWASANGEYILSNNSLFDPNQNSNFDWEKIRVRR